MAKDELWRRGAMGMDPKLDGFRIPVSDRCWWCGDVATTEEHRFKRQALKRRAEDADGSLNPGNLFKKSPDFAGSLHSIDKGSQIRWRKNLCADCNNAKSRPFDLASDQFDEYLFEHADEPKHWKRLKWSSIYGKEHKEKSRDLARYFAKQLGCMLAGQRLPVPQDLKDFLNGAKQCPSVCFSLFIDPTTDDPDREWFKHGEGVIPSSLLHPHTGHAYAKDGEFSGFTFAYQIGYIVVSADWWAEGVSKPSWFKHRSVDLPRYEV